MIRGEIVLFDYPFSDRTGSKLRPALVCSFIACRLCGSNQPAPPGSLFDRFGRLRAGVARAASHFLNEL